MSIKVITEPSVYVLARQDVDHDELERFMTDHGFPVNIPDPKTRFGEWVCEVAGRLCYMSFAKPRPGGNAAYLKHIIESGHGSVLEHAVWTLLITGVSRSLTHELVRHRVGLSPSQLSQRYVDESDVAFIVPPALMDEVQEAIRRIGTDTGLAFIKAVAEAMNDEGISDGTKEGIKWVCGVRQDLLAYRSLTDYLAGKGGIKLPGGGKTITTDRRKRAREAARSVLPNCTETKIALTGNARAWRNVLEQRGGEGADAEIRRLALKLHSVLLAEAPALFGDYEVRQGEHGPYLHTEHRKV